MKSSDTPPAKRLRRLSGSRRSTCSRYFVVSPIHNLRIMPPSGRTSCIGSPDLVVVKTLLLASSPESRGPQRDRPSAESNHHVVWRKSLTRQRIEQHAHIPYTHGSRQACSALATI